MGQGLGDREVVGQPWPDDAGEILDLIDLSDRHRRPYSSRSF